MQTKRLSELESDTDFDITHDFWGKTERIMVGEVFSGNPALLPNPC